MRTGRSIRAFSLTELLVVVAVIFVLMALLVVVVQGVYSQAAQLKCQQHLEQIGHALQMYSAKYHGRLPQSWEPYSGRIWYEALAMTALDNPAVLGCPSVGDSPLASGGGSPGAPVNRESADDLLKALRWLKSKQVLSGDYRGAFNSETYYAGQYYCSMSGLSLLSFLGFGCNDGRPSEFAGTVKAGVEFLASAKAQQKTDDSAGYNGMSNKGMFLNPTNGAPGPKRMYTQGISVMALCGAARVAEDPSLRQRALAAAQLGIEWIDRMAAQVGGNFGYDGPWFDFYGPRADLSAGAWAYHATGAAKLAGLAVSDALMANADNYFLHCTGKSTNPQWDGGGCYWYDPNALPGSGADRGYSNTSVGLAARLAIGQSPGSGDVMRQANWLKLNGQPQTWLNSEDAAGRGQNYTVFFNTEAMYRLGGDWWTTWHTYFLPYLMKWKLSASEDMIYWPAAAACDIGGGTTTGALYATAMACMSLEAGYSDNWFLPTWRPPTASCSYGYNNRLGLDLRTPAGDTILVMDYEKWEIDRDDNDVATNDDDSKISLRHGGRANVLFGDGSVRPMRLENFKSGMWTPKPAD